MQNRYDCVSPLDFRYYGQEADIFERLQPFVSETAFIRFQARVERAIIQGFAHLGWIEPPVADQLVDACDAVTADEVYEDEKTTSHVVRSLVNCIARRVAPEAGRFVHLFATSADITDTATALRFQELVRDVLLPDLLALQGTLIELAQRHADRPQVGRTHGRHAVPVTFGFAMALYVDRLAGRIEQLEAARQRLPGQLSGAVGAYNALALKLPESAPLFEKLVLGYLGLEPAPGSISSQIVQPEYLVDLGYAAHSAFSVLANLADDMRHLHRSEIGEVQEEVRDQTVGSSTMPHKVNPKNFENIKSLWKAFTPRIMTLMMDQICEHQRDLTNSASQRFIPELFTALDYSVVRLDRTMKVLQIDDSAMQRNIQMSADQIVAEPLYVLLALDGCPGAYDHVRTLARKARQEGKPLMELADHDAQIGPYVKKMNRAHLAILHDPIYYTGHASRRTRAICQRRSQDAAALNEYLQQERRVLEDVKPQQLDGIRDQIQDLEKGRKAPADFCPAEDRKKRIERWIREAPSPSACVSV